MPRHRKPKTPVDWDRARRWAKTVTLWVDLFLALAALLVILTGKS
ncbi:hypothetical protein [Streptomyces cinnamoneus]|uniref:Uncharacterized protein n=1 Tax=Streptomyces cinnamoneus TaxID=53446 RepID=A0A918TYA3_STRCJ|nr:hypothetical protein [Streptomyces cinnamoneus]GHC64375.1 hypothetical protein GCM10010507_47130 [Streptomyces cinnamoneus]